MLLAFLALALAEPQYECVAIPIVGTNVIIPRANMSDMTVYSTELPPGWVPVGGGMIPSPLSTLGGMSALPAIFACRRIDDGRDVGDDLSDDPPPAPPPAAPRTDCESLRKRIDKVRKAGVDEDNLPKLPPECIED